jgi:hypothetical protein
MLFPSREDNALNINEASHLVDMMQPSQDSSNPMTIDLVEFVRFFFRSTRSSIQALL